MSRYRFGVWGIKLDDDAFAEALAGAGVANLYNPSGIAEFHVPRVPPELSVEDALQRWQSSQPVRQLEVVDAGGLDPLWLAATLARAVPHGGVHFRRDEPDVAVAWQWPLRIGLFADDRASELRTALTGRSTSRLVEFVEVGKEPAECELLLIPCNLRAAVQRVLAAAAPITADCTIVLGGPKVDSERVEALLAVIRGEVRTAGVALGSVPKSARQEWLRVLIEHLSHSETIDTALCAAARATGIAAPLMYCSRKLAELATLRHFAERLGTAMKNARRREVSVDVDAHASSQLRVPQTASVEDLGGMLESMAPSYDYQYESGDATAIVETREAVERSTLERIEVPRMTRSMPPAPAPMTFELPMPAAVEAKVETERFLRASFFDQTKAIRLPMIAADTPYFLRVHIGPPEGPGAVANVALDESQLPASPTGHELTIALFELREDDHAPASPPARATVHLPPEKDRPSTYAWFPILAPKSGAFAARIVVLHQTRVLQTLLFRAPLHELETAFTLTQENVIHPGFDILGTRRAFDAALVVNKAGGKSAVMGITAKSVTYNEPEGITDAIEAIANAITELTKLPDKVKLTDPAVIKVLISLAHDGHLISDWIAQKLPPELATAERIQIVEARPGAFLPLEFVYPSFAPNDDAKLCPHGKDELAEARKTKCPNERDRKFVCPSVFWGFSRVIERWPHMDLEDNFNYRLSVPKPNHTTIDPLQTAILGASKRVAPADVASAKKAVKAAVKSNVHVVPTWNDWPDAIRTHSPSLLVLFPHSEEKDGKQALEVGEKFLKVGVLEDDYVRTEESDPGPLVLLLGCSTQLPRVAFHNFVGRFREKGASIVVGTLSIIRGRHATRFVKEFLDVLKKKSGTNTPFGEVLLETKQTMLAAGDPFALTVVAYGDADWRL